MRKFRVIAFDVYKKNIKSVAFLMMILVPFIMMGFVYFVGKFADDVIHADKIGVVSEQAVLAEQAKQLKSDDYSFKVVKSEKQAQKQLNNEDIDAYLVISTKGDTVKGVLYSESTMGTSTEMVLQQFLTAIQSSGRAQALGLDSEEVASLNASAKFTREKVSFDEDGKMMIGEDNSAAQQGVSYMATIILFVIMMAYAQIIAQEIASEKGTRIMEVILSSTKAQIHYYGKIAGVLMVALTQMILYGVIFGIGFPEVRKMDFVQQMVGDVDLGKLFGSYLVYTMVFVVLGILIYSVLAALCGSLVNRVEDTGKAIMPVMYLSLGGYMLALILGMANPNSPILRITSYIPFLSSYTMPVRLANDTVTTSGTLISVGILVLSTLALMLFSARIYKSNVLVYSEGGILASLKQSLSIMKNEKQAK